MAEDAQDDLLDDWLPAVDTESAIYATVVDTEGRLLRLRRGDGGVVEMVLKTGRGPQVRRFDRFQSGALRQAMTEMGSDG